MATPDAEAADMRHVSHPTGALVGSGDAADAAHELEDNPEPRTTSAGMATTCVPSRTFTRDRGNIRISAPSTPPNRAGSPDIGHARFWRDGILRERRGDAGQQVKNEKFQVPELVLDITAKRSTDKACCRTDAASRHA